MRLDGVTKVRPWDSWEEMNEALVKNWNEVVGPNDLVYHLGDVVFQGVKSLPIVSRLNGKKYLTLGNHDYFKLEEYGKYFDKIHMFYELPNMVLSHFPMHTGTVLERYGVNVHGHIHEKDINSGNHFNVSVENIDYRPIELSVLEAKIKEKQEKYKPSDKSFIWHYEKY
jgi:calcineurin-like phosphoesterase family protein